MSIPRGGGQCQYRVEADSVNTVWGVECQYRVGAYSVNTVWGRTGGNTAWGRTMLIPCGGVQCQYRVGEGVQCQHRVGEYMQGPWYMSVKMITSLQFHNWESGNDSMIKKFAVDKD